MGRLKKNCQKHEDLELKVTSSDPLLVCTSISLSIHCMQSYNSIGKFCISIFFVVTLQYSGFEGAEIIGPQFIKEHQDEKHYRGLFLCTCTLASDKKINSKTIAHPLCKKADRSKGRKKYSLDKDFNQRSSMTLTLDIETCFKVNSPPTHVPTSSLLIVRI